MSIIDYDDHYASSDGETFRFELEDNIIKSIGLWEDDYRNFIKELGVIEHVGALHSYPECLKFLNDRRLECIDDVGCRFTAGLDIIGNNDIIDALTTIKTSYNNQYPITQNLLTQFIDIISDQIIIDIRDEYLKTRSITRDGVRISVGDSLVMRYKNEYTTVIIDDIYLNGVDNDILVKCHDQIKPFKSFNDINCSNIHLKMPDQNSNMIKTPKDRIKMKIKKLEDELRKLDAST